MVVEKEDNKDKKNSKKDNFPVTNRLESSLTHAESCNKNDIHLTTKNNDNRNGSVTTQPKRGRKARTITELDFMGREPVMALETGNVADNEQLQEPDCKETDLVNNAIDRQVFANMTTEQIQIYARFVSIKVNDAIRKNKLA
ncbi:8200_t:CDS:2 [Paraglomus occultum]|uniref:8200_t:CDS:1 n=1 Tax=Paraglomus occultum TaxID=144539 RepID=A0A9N9GHE8_9GLOM|nr:8200_t:CDS:2 [Paraglomus occultum]